MPRTARSAHGGFIYHELNQRRVTSFPVQQEKGERGQRKGEEMRNGNGVTH